MMSVVRPFEQAIERLLHEVLALGVERARGLVEDEDARILQDGARDGDALLLPAGELHAALADERRVALGEARDEVVGVGGAGGGLDLGVGRGALSVADVLGDRAREEHRLLRDDADLTAQPLRIEIAQVAAVEEDAPASGS